VLYLDFMQPNHQSLEPLETRKTDGKYYGMMIVEGVIAMIWAAAAMSS
jgi:hypothetical protein